MDVQQRERVPQTRIFISGADSAWLNRAVHESGSAARGHVAVPQTHAVQVMSEPDCWRLLVHTRMGRLAVDAVDGAPDIFPVNYLASPDRHLYVRSGPGSKMMAMAAHRSVAFEIDGCDETVAWSVVVRGVAERLDSDDEIEASGILDLVSWSPTAKQNFVRITPRSMTGRSFLLSGEATSAAVATQDRTAAVMRSRPPREIPHFSPLR